MADLDTVVEIDPNFGMPEGLSDVVETDPSASSSEETRDIDLTVDAHGDDYFDTGEDEIPGDLTPPETIEILPQVVRTAPDGRQVIDVYIEVEESGNELNYEIRVTKE